MEVEEFLRSVHRSFRANQAAAPSAAGLLLLLLGAVLGVALALLLRRLLARRARLRRVAALHGLGADDVAWARERAREAGVEPVDLLVQPDLFERLTAAALAAPSPPGAPDPEAVIRRLRSGLGFDRLPAHHPLLTTRELAAGTAVDLDGTRGEVARVGERSFEVELRGTLAPEVGAVAAVTLVHAREARYAARCPVLALRRAADGSLAVELSHDEAPVRLQRREFVRVPARGPVLLHPLPDGLVPWAQQPAPVEGELADLGGGGLRVLVDAPLRTGLLVGLSFTAAGEPFPGLKGVVLGSERAGGRHALHLAFSGLEEARQDRLVAAVERLEHEEVREG